MRIDFVRRSSRKQRLALWLVRVAVGLLLPSAFAGHGFYVHTFGGYRGCGPGGYGYGAHPGFRYGGQPLGYGFSPFRHSRLVGGGVHYSGPYSSYYGRYAYPGYYGYSRFGFPGCGLTRPFSFDQPRIYVYPQAPAVNCVPAESSYRRLIILNPNPEETEAAELPEHTLPPVPDEAALRPVQPKAIDPAQAWTYLENGSCRDALSAFAALAAEGPEQGSPKVGFGLAAALAGDKITAAYALRRAFETDPQGAVSVRLGPGLRGRLQALAGSYDQTARKEPNNLNVQFLFAAVSYFAEDHAAAQACLAKAVSAGDNSGSTANLQKMVEHNLVGP